MAPEQWYSSADSFVPPGEEAAAPKPAAIFELRPLSLGEILDRTFTVYRSRFWLFAGIATTIALIHLVLNSIRVVTMHVLLVHRMDPAMVNGINAIVTGIISLIVFLPYAVAQAATVFAVGQVYLGQPASIGSSLRAVAGKWYRYIGIVVWQFWSMIWIMLVLLVPAFMLVSSRVTGLVALGGFLMFVGGFGGLIAGFILYLRNALAVPAAVVEALTMRAAMRRSKDLAAGTKGRIFVVLLISIALYAALATLQSPLTVMIMIARAGGKDAFGAEIGLLLTAFLGSTLITPVAMLGLTLLYFDQRVRHEAFDLELLLAAEAGAAEAILAAPAAVKESAAATSTPFATEAAAAEAPAAPIVAAEPAFEPVSPEAAVAEAEAIEPTHESAGQNGDATNA